eukprot:CAMPEP_0118699052 /NCGR_PEP_ID=MMETSP0800-20121206/15624_1 /TAXON_ID=210618 ORGANISM="Striatella unipunctata, Strain CCMP2910" /NCGR_SAMPLE_ID=MMETSP0800 /ASSEMBLY_ACC=CAM_ASM_000638 /LENGTH=231 /DNA_ID=CAMNT_0006599105 /DNA_START=1 /DNA_END=695 /DNA_ORIENTATION=-
MISGGPPLNVTGGLYQMGMIMSKFAIGKRLTVMDGFRPGFFSLQVKSIGFYKTVPAEETNAVVATATTTTPETLSKSEVTKKRPLLLKLLFPILGALFSEKANRRKSAVKLLQQKRGLSRLGVINYGIKLRTTRDGLLLGLAKTGAITLGDMIRNGVQEDGTIARVQAPLYAVESKNKQKDDDDDDDDDDEYTRTKHQTHTSTGLIDNALLQFIMLHNIHKGRHTTNRPMI